MAKLVNILVITKDSVFAASCESFLREHPVAFQILSCGAAVVRRFQEEPCDIVLIDDSFTDLGAIEIALTIRDLFGDTTRVMVFGVRALEYAHVWESLKVFATEDMSVLLNALKGAVILR